MVYKQMQSLKYPCCGFFSFIQNNCNCVKNPYLRMKLNLLRNKPTLPNEFISQFGRLVHKAFASTPLQHKGYLLYVC